MAEQRELIGEIASNEELRRLFHSAGIDAYVKRCVNGEDRGGMQQYQDMLSASLGASIKRLENRILQNNIQAASVGGLYFVMPPQSWKVHLYGVDLSRVGTVSGQTISDYKPLIQNYILGLQPVAICEIKEITTNAPTKRMSDVSHRGLPKPEISGKAEHVDVMHAKPSRRIG